MIGRPPKPPDEVRSHRIRLRFSDEEIAEIEEQAQGRPLLEFMREVIEEELRRPSKVPQANPRIAGQLAGFGSHLNPLVRLAHTGHVSDQLEPLLRRLNDAVATYQRELGGLGESSSSSPVNGTPEEEEEEKQ